MKLTTTEFVKRAKEKYGDDYNYSPTKYRGYNTPVKIKCNWCGKIFERTPHRHLAGSGCPFCGPKPGRKNYTTKEFIEKAKEKYGDTYDYSMVNYINAKTKIKIKCNKCGYVFERKPSDFLRGAGCVYCMVYNKKPNQ